MDESVSATDPAYWLAMLRIPGIRYQVVEHLLGAFSSPRGIFSARPAALAHTGLNARLIDALRRPDWDGVKADLRWLERPRHSLVTLGDADFPPLLRQIPDPPLALFICGERRALHSVQLAVVGSRSASADGRRNARAFARDLVGCGLAVTSGMAIGVDSAAHRAALDAGGITIAVLGSGPDIVYPARNRRLADAIAERGAVISEFSAGTMPLPSNFPRRNRVISGLSVGTLVVEAGLRSGSLITAKHALDQGREVFAIPSTIRNPVARGCHDLIRNGAKLVEQISDILDEIQPLTAVAAGIPEVPDCDRQQAKDLDAESKLLLDNIGYVPVNIDSLIDATHLPAGSAASILAILEIAGLVESLPGGNFVRR